MIFEAAKLDEKELEVLRAIDEMRQALRHRVIRPKRWYGLLRRNSFARAIRGSNSIEGYNVSKEDAIAAAEGDEPTEAKGTTWLAVTGYRNAMTFVLQLAQDPKFVYNQGFIRSLHYMMLHYDLAKHPGNWRPGPIYVLDEAKREIVYEGPEAERVPSLMHELNNFLNDKGDPSEVTIRAAMAHLNLVLIHPFSDGNGRMARCLQTLVLAREGILDTTFGSIEEYLGANTQDYYRALEETAKGSWQPHAKTTEWIRFNLIAHYRQASTLLRRTNIIDRLWGEIEREVERRDLPERSIFALADAAIGYKVRNASYRGLAEVTPNLASRDLQLMVDRGLLIAVGEKRGREYIASDYLKEIRSKIGAVGKIPNPFKEMVPTGQLSLLP
jgi:Fic family protein